MKVCWRRSSRFLERSMSSHVLQRFPFETQNGEHYWALKDNKSYQNARPGYKGSTFSQQSKLPSLVVPELGATLNKYLQTIKPYCGDPAEYSRQEMLCKDFAEHMGPVLQQRLVEFASTRRNWMSEFWDNQSYLEYNDPVIPYVSYFYCHKPLPISHKAIESDPLMKATAIIVTVSNFIEALKDESLPPEVIRGTPFCMNSFHLMFNTSRLPGPPQDNRDTNIFYSIYENNFIVVAFKGNFYKVTTHDPQTNKPLSPNEIWSQLYSIVNAKSAHLQCETNSGIGFLTSLPRDQWRVAYQELIKNPLSQHSLETIHRASYIVALDDANPVTFEEKSRNTWHGNGYNRYFDKSLQFVVTQNGSSGSVNEHSKMDGTPTCFLNHYVVQEMAKLNPSAFVEAVRKPSEQRGTVTHLPFLVTPPVKQWINTARQAFEKVIGEHDLRVWHYNRFGKKLIKKHGMSPDAFIQQVMQLAVYKYLGKQLPTYEAASTRMFFKGRTETGRSVSEASHNFVTGWQDPDVSPKDKIMLLRESAKYHSNYLKAAAAGLGIDRHFFGMKNMLKPGDPTPPLFSNPLFNYSSTWLISTSQLSSELFDGYGWSQVNDNGFGLAYMLNDDWLHINIVNKPLPSGLSVDKLHYYLTLAADELHDALDAQENIKAKL
ncbi:hypothetical protein HG536_0A05300 [Torulaspora globosa]|uniref:Carnitine O-acetyltransferase, mitochondrial n=1 Tax=Torulaspora globosa TaxID=48254 RepID=A0A7G3ZB29_9SACH|nr:uncharacterized protein HG536_0A05300 [Torulaspora globosa]QLL30715.1 hypothetical protein HG536_0A05300 [Torulaspora globosa]